MKMLIEIEDTTEMTVDEVAAILRALATTIQKNGDRAFRACPQTREILMTGGFLGGANCAPVGTWKTERIDEAEQ